MSRIERQRVLYGVDKQFRFVIPEAVLRWPYGPPDDPAVPDEHREQLARVEWAAGRPNVEVGILPPRPVAVWRTAGFVIFDEVEDGEALVHLEMLTRPYNVSDPEQVDMYRQGFANLLGASVTGEEAQRLITQAARDLREGSPLWAVTCQSLMLSTLSTTWFRRAHRAGGHAAGRL